MNYSDLEAATVVLSPPDFFVVDALCSYAITVQLSCANTCSFGGTALRTIYVGII